MSQQLKCAYRLVFPKKRTNLATSLFDESEHPRGQPDNAGEFVAKEAAPTQPKAEAQKPPVDTSKPHFKGTKESPYAFFVKPGAGPGGKDEEIYHADVRYLSESGKYTVEALHSEATQDLIHIDEIAQGEHEAGDANEMQQAIGDATGKLHAKLSDAIDRWMDRFTQTLEHRHGGDRKLHDEQGIQDKAEKAKDDIYAVLEEDDYSPLQVANSMDDDDWDEDAIVDVTDSAASAIRDILTDLHTDILGHVEELEDKVKDRDEKEESDADDFALEMQDDYEGDNGEEAVERAKEINEALAEANNPYRVYYSEEEDQWFREHHEDIEGDYPGKPATTLATQHAPVGGIKIRGKQFAGGEFIPTQVFEKATPEQRAQIEHRRDMFDPEDWTPPARQKNIFDEIPSDAKPIEAKPEAKANAFPVAAKEKAKAELDAAWASHDMTPEAEERWKTAADKVHAAIEHDMGPVVEKWKPANRLGRIAIVKKFADEHGIDPMTAEAIIQNHAEGKKFGAEKAVEPEPDKDSHPVRSEIVEPPSEDKPRARKVPGRQLHKMPDGVLGSEFLITMPDGTQKRGLGRNGPDAIKRLLEGHPEAKSPPAAAGEQEPFGGHPPLPEKKEESDSVKPSADRHDAIHAELKGIYKDPKFADGDPELVNKAVELEREMQIHKPAAIDRAQKEIDGEKAGKEKPEAAMPTDKPVKADIALADTFAKMFDVGEKIDSKEIWKIADKHHGGSRAQGTYGPSDAYDSLEAGFNKHLIGKTDPTADLADAQKQAEEIAAKIEQLPTQTNRSGEKDTHQQFSTPPHYAYAAAWLANLSPNDVVLEPSAGTACLAVQAANSGAEVYTNEYSDRRAELLRDLFGSDKVHVEDAEQISAILPNRGVPAPSVVLMNPPFSQTAGRLGNKKDTMTGARHIEEALRTLADGGRLVSIVGRGMDMNSPTFRDWFKKMQEKYNLRANIEVSGDEYSKYGTKFGTRMLVFDKTGPQDGNTITGSAESIPDLMAKLAEVRNGRAQPETDQRTAGKQVGGNLPAASKTASSAGLADTTATGNVVAGDERRSGSMGDKAGGARVTTKQASGRSVDAAGQPGGVSGRPGSESEQAGPDTQGSPGGATPNAEGRKKPRVSRKAAGGKLAEQPSAVKPTLRPAVPLKYNERSETKAEKVGESGAPEGTKAGSQSDAQSHLSEALFEQYKPARIDVPGAHKHPTALVESAAMSAVPPPKATYQPHLSPDVIEKGLLSEAALESVIYAGQAHETMLPAAEGEPEVRRGFFIGDGTGAGKGRQIAGIITDNFNQGRKKAVWLTEKKTLLEDARRDWGDVGNEANQVFPFQDLQKGKAPDEGVSLITYDTLKGKPKDPSAASNLKKLADWLGPNFDGVIAFDESHNLSNAMTSEGGRGKKEPSKKALAGVELQKMFPKARIVYVSATGATNVSNLAYTERLGLWGRGTPFAKKEQFIDEMERGGVAAMECVAQNLKAMGGYTARSLSFDDGTPKGKVTYDRLTHEMTLEQKNDYDAMATGWQHVLQNINEALKVTGGKDDAAARSAAASQFWGAQQRFFNQVMTSMQTPSVVRDIEKQVAEGKSPVIQLTNTMEASTKRAAAKREEDQDYEELDVSPKEILMQYLEKSFPVHRYEKYKDSDGNELSRIVTDSNGDPIVDPEAVKIREGLMERLGSLRVPDSPLDMIIHHFGHDQVAEVTGRTQRFVYQPDENGKLVKTLEPRNAHNANSAETEAFQSGRKKILVFSQAGGTGRSYHADKNAPNNAQRVHYLLQPGWRADAAVQGLGRTHRTNQESAPLYRLVEIDALKAQKRFVSTIARRLDQLGALTRGQRQAGSTGIFKAADNLESPEARQALDSFFNDLSAGRIEGLSYNDVLTQMGFKKDDDKPGKKFDTPPMTQFLNRLLSLKVDTQSKVFDAYEQRLQSRVEQAMRDGTLDVGVENYPADKIIKKGENVVHRDAKTGAEAKHVVMTAIRKAEKTPFETTTKGKQPLHYVRNLRSGRVYAVYTANPKTDARTGQIIDQVRLMGPTSSGSRPAHELDFDDYDPKYEKLETSSARKLWDEEHDAAPENHESTEHFIMGAFLPVWDRIPGDKPKIYRMRTDDGQTVVGRHIPSAMVEQTLKNLNVHHDKEKIDPAAIHKRISAGQSEAKLSNGWKLKPAMVGGERRIELTGPSYHEISELEKDGIIKERIRYDTRYFVPVGAEGAKVLARITEHRPIVEETGKSTTLSTSRPTMPRPAYVLHINGKPVVTLATSTPNPKPYQQPQRKLAYRLTFGKR